MISQNKNGIIVNCLWTAVYEYPTIYSNPIYGFQMLDKIEVLPEFSTDPDFYAVAIPDDRIGYCLKKNIVLREQRAV